MGWKYSTGIAAAMIAGGVAQIVAGQHGTAIGAFAAAIGWAAAALEEFGCAKAVSAAEEAEREACKAACRKIGSQYPTDIWPEDGKSIDCKSARMARLTAANCEREIDMRSNVELRRLRGFSRRSPRTQG